MKFFKEYFNIILKYANEYKPPRHNTKFTNEYYLHHILNVLSNVVTWKDLMNIKTIKSGNTYHYKTISKIHLEWARNGVYERAYNQTLEDENIKITDNNFIDGTLIINKSGIECIGYGCGESRKKKFTSLTSVCNDNTKPVSIICNENYNKVIATRKGIQKTIRTLPHDSQSIIPAINDISKKYGDIKYNLIGDAGFIFNTANIPSNINLITVKRKNQKDQNTENDKIRLKGRYKIENLFAKIKVFNRIHVRRDKLIASFMGFVYIAVMKII
jgi:hypothetical protein